MFFGQPWMKSRPDVGVEPVWQTTAVMLQIVDSGRPTN